MSVSVVQQNKNKFNKISNILSKELRSYDGKYPFEVAKRSCVISVKSTDLVMKRIELFLKCSPDTHIIMVESGNKIYWCYRIKSCYLYQIDTKGLDVSGISLSGNISNAVKAMVQELLQNQLDPSRVRYRKHFRPDEWEEAKKYVKDWDKYSSPADNLIIWNSELYKLMMESVLELINSKITITRHPDVIKSVKDLSLFPLFWYNCADGSYNYQREDNYSYSPSVQGRKVVDGNSFEHDVDSFIERSVMNNPIENWGIIHVDCPLLVKGYTRDSIDVNRHS